MKKISIEIVIDELTGQVAVAKRISGYNQNNISHRFEIIGILSSIVDEENKLLKTKFNKEWNLKGGQNDGS